MIAELFSTIPMLLDKCIKSINKWIRKKSKPEIPMASLEKNQIVTLKHRERDEYRKKLVVYAVHYLRFIDQTPEQCFLEIYGSNEQYHSYDWRVHSTHGFIHD